LISTLEGGPQAEVYFLAFLFFSNFFLFICSLILIAYHYSFPVYYWLVVISSSFIILLTVIS